MIAKQSVKPLIKIIVVTTRLLLVSLAALLPLLIVNPSVKSASLILVTIERINLANMVVKLIGVTALLNVRLVILTIAEIEQQYMFQPMDIVQLIIPIAHLNALISLVTLDIINQVCSVLRLLNVLDGLILMNLPTILVGMMILLITELVHIGMMTALLRQSGLVFDPLLIRLTVLVNIANITAIKKTLKIRKPSQTRGLLFLEIIVD